MIQKHNKPKIKLYLTRDNFNSLMSKLIFFINTKREIGDNPFCDNAETLKAKILKYGRAYKRESGEGVTLNFFEKESAVLIKLFTQYLDLREIPVGDYYDTLKKESNK